MTRPTGPPPRILYISNDDHGGDGHRLKYLAEAGLAVAKARGESAVTTAITFQPAVIVLDFDFDGEVVAALKAAEETKDIPVIALAKLAAW